MRRTLAFLVVSLAVACSDAVGPPDKPEFFLVTDSLSYTLKETGTPGVFHMNLVTRYTNPLPDTLHFYACGPGPMWFFEHMTGADFTQSENSPGCAISFIGMGTLLPGEVRTDTLLWLISSRGANLEGFMREIPGTFRVVHVVWDSVGENLTGREIAKELRVSNPFEILPVAGTGG